MASTLTAPPSSDAQRGKRFVLNVFWNWLGVGVSIISGLLLSPYMIRKLGPDGYGVWTLSFALVEYYWFFDLGFRSAMVKYVAHYWARAEFDKVSEVVNTGVAYAGVTAAFMFVAVAVGARYADRFFKVPAGYGELFFVLVLLVSLSWCVSVVFSLFGACLEALQRFDYYNRIMVIVITIRAPGTLLLLYMGYGLIAIGVLTVSSQILGYMLHFYYFRKVFPEYRLSVRQSSMPMLRQMGRYGIHNFVGNLSTQVLNQGPPVLIGHFLQAAFVGYFSIPIRLLQSTGEAVGRIGIITNSNAAELVAKGETRALSQLAVFTNRYCVTIFMPLAIMFFAYGGAFFRLWIPAVASFVTPLMPIMLTAYVIAIVGQFSSSMLLMGLARYQWYSRGLLVEAAVSFLGLTWVLPHYGLIGGAWWISAAMILNRGLFLPWLVSRVMNFRFVWFMNSIYTRPALVGVAVYALAAWMARTILPGRTWLELFGAAVVVGAVYYAVAFVVCLPSEHRELLIGWLRNKLASRRSRASSIAQDA